MTLHFCRNTLLSTTALFACALSLPAHAQDDAAAQEASDSGLGEIVVTAHKRAENL